MSKHIRSESRFVGDVSNWTDAVADGDKSNPVRREEVAHAMRGRAQQDSRCDPRRGFLGCPPATHDVTWLKAFLDGFQEAIGAIQGILRGHFGTSGHIDDLGQETFLRSFRHASRVRDSKRIKELATVGWFARVAYSVLADHLRSEQRQKAIRAMLARKSDGHSTVKAVTEGVGISAAYEAYLASIRVRCSAKVLATIECLVLCRGNREKVARTLNVSTRTIERHIRAARSAVEAGRRA